MMVFDGYVNQQKVKNSPTSTSVVRFDWSPPPEVGRRAIFVSDLGNPKNPQDASQLFKLNLWARSFC
jgi:hypothetical protein